MQKNEARSSPQTIYKINSKWFKELNTNAKTIKLLGRKDGEKLHDTGTVDDFLDITQKAKTVKQNTEKLNFIKVRNFCASKDTINMVKRQSLEWEKTFANHKSDKGFYPEYIKD